MSRTIPQTHTHDPRSAYEAEARMVASGRMASHEAKVMEMVRRRPGSTGAELAQRFPEYEMDKYEVRRRLSGLRSKGYVRREAPRVCEVAGESASTWYPAAGDAVVQARMFGGA